MGTPRPVPVVRFDRVSKRFDENTLALDEVDVIVERGEIVTMLGLSGSGKSTLLRLVNGLHRPTAGRVEVLGTDVGTASGRELRALRRRIGVVFQQFQLVGRLSALENVCTGALGSLAGPRLGLVSYPKALRHGALEQLDRVGLSDAAFQRADTLSGGQQQRVAIARALIQRPEILLADEPVASLDPDSARVVMGLIREIAAEDGLTVVCSLHQVELALSWAHRIIGLRDGAVVLRSSAQELSAAAAMAVYERVGGAVTTAGVAR